MRILELAQLNGDLLSPVKYFGLEILTPPDAKYLACDEDGGLYSFREKPKFANGCWQSKGPETYLATLKLSADAERSLIKI